MVSLIGKYEGPGFEAIYGSTIIIEGIFLVADSGTFPGKPPCIIGFQAEEPQR